MKLDLDLSRLIKFVEDIGPEVERALDKKSPAEFVAAFDIDADKFRAMLGTLSDEEIAFLYSAGGHMANGCCPKGLAPMCNSVGAKMNECVRNPKVRAMIDGESAERSAQHGDAAANVEEAANLALKNAMFAQIFGGGGNPGSLN